MGTWGTGILSDDTARDLYDEFVELYDAGIELSEIRRRIEEEYRASLEAMDEGPLVWLALAKGQWECDALDADVLARIERIVTTGEGLERWREAGSNLLAKRRRVLTRFLEQLRQPKGRPRKRRPLKKHQAVYEVGTCLAVHGLVFLEGAALAGPSLGLTQLPPQETPGRVRSRDLSRSSTAQRRV